MAWPEFVKHKNGHWRRRNPKTGQMEAGSWYPADRDPVTKKHTSEKPGRSYSDAVDRCHEINAEAAKNKKGLTRFEMTVGEAVEKYLAFCAEAHVQKTTQRKREVMAIFLKYFHRDRLVDSIDSGEFLEMRDRYMAGHCKNGAITLVKQLRPFFTYCLERNWIRKNPGNGALRGFKCVSVARFLTDEEVRSLRTAALLVKSKNGQVGDIIDIALFTGMRKSELLGLKRSYIGEQSITLPTGKNDDPRVIPIHDEIRPILEKYKGAEDMFHMWNLDRLKNCWRRTKKLVKLSGGIKGRFRFHDLRHTFASNYLRGSNAKKGVTMTTADLRLIMGHRSLATLQIYAHFQENDLATKIQNMSCGFMGPELKVVG